MNAVLEVEQLVVRYGGVLAVKGISFQVGEREIVSILGANGAGKTSTLFGLSGIIERKGRFFGRDEVSGRILFKGVDIGDLSNDRRVKMGLVLCPENRRNFPELTVEENLRMGAFLRGDFRRNLDMAYSLFPRLEERRKQQAHSLSGGEQQMLAIARALMSDPVLLLLDEPSLGLSPVLIDELFELLAGLADRGTPMLLVEQNAVKALSISDRAYILETGEIVHMDRADALLSDEKVKRAYLGM